jgi:hypothetical protein
MTQQIPFRADDGTVRESRQLMRQQNMEYEQSLGKFNCFVLIL